MSSCARIYAQEINVSVMDTKKIHVWGKFGKNKVIGLDAINGDKYVIV